MGQQFNALKAAELYCPTCRVSQPVRERAVESAGSRTVELLCFRCRTVVGTHTTTEDRSFSGRLARFAGRLLRGLG